VANSVMKNAELAEE